MNKSKLQNQYNTLIKEHQTLKLTRKKNPELTLENHHILPTSLGGGDESKNLVMLTAAKHFEAHSLLADLGTKQMINAFWWMCQTMRDKGVEITAEEYEKSRKLYVESITGEGNPMFGRTGEDHPKFRVVTPDDVKIKQSAAKIGNQYCKGYKHTQEHRDKVTGVNHHHYDHTIRNFEHKDGATFEGTGHAFRAEYRLDQGNVCGVIRGTLKTVKGWHLVTDQNKTAQQPKDDSTSLQ